jgi:hypothetical protein
MKTIYLAGPISGRPSEEYVLHFDDVAGELRRRIAADSLDIAVFNPVGYCDGVVDDGSPWHVYMRACIAQLATCDGIGLLQGWDKSRGALLELNTAIQLNIPVVYIEPPLSAFDLYTFFGNDPVREPYRYYCQRLRELETINPDTAEDRAIVETVNRYLDPHGFEYIEEPF